MRIAYNCPEGESLGTETVFSLEERKCIEGQEITEYAVGTGNTDLQLPANLASGLYIGVFKPDSGGAVNVVRLVYEPQK